MITDDVQQHAVNAKQIPSMKLLLELSLSLLCIENSVTPMNDPARATKVLLLIVSSNTKYDRIPISKGLMFIISDVWLDGMYCKLENTSHQAKHR